MTESKILHWKQQSVNAFWEIFAVFYESTITVAMSPPMTLLIAPGSVELISSLNFDVRCYQLRLFLEIRSCAFISDRKCLCFSFGLV
jgi:hypothetical protein